MGETNSSAESSPCPHSSLNKAAHLLGVTEINNFDYKSLNSIRKLAKTLGCNEYDLMKTFSNSASSCTEIESSTAQVNKTPQVSNSQASTLAASIRDSILHVDNLKLHDQLASNNSPTSIRILKKFTVASPKFLEKNPKLKETKPPNNSKISPSLLNSSKSKDDSTAKTFKRTIIKKKLPPRLYLKAKQHLEAEKLGKEINVMDRFQIIECSKREVILVKDDNYGFGFIAGSEKPLVIRFVSQDGPGKDKLLNGDEILSINGENVQYSSREYVINLIRQSTNELRLVVKQPTPKSSTSLLLTEDKKALKKKIAKNKKNKVRFCLDDDKTQHQQNLNEQNDEQETNTTSNTDSKQSSSSESPEPSVELNSSNENENSIEIASSEITTESDNENNLDTKICTSIADDLTDHQESRSSILKVYMENKCFKTFKYDNTTCVRDVLNCLRDKLDINSQNCYGLVLKLNDQNCVSSLVLLEENRHLYTIKELYGGRQNSSYQCMLRFLFVPSNFDDLIYSDVNSFNYLYEQSFSDVLNERYGNELKYEMMLHLASLSILHHYVKDMEPDNLDKIDLNTDYELSQFLPKSFLNSKLLNDKDLKKLLNQNLDWFVEKNFLNKQDIKLEYLRCMNELLQFSGRIFFATLLNEKKEAFIIIGSNYGIATFIDVKSKTLLNLAKFDSIENIRVTSLSSDTVKIDIDLFDETSENDILHKTLVLGLSKEDYLPFLYLLQGYLRINVFPVKNRLCPIQEIKLSGSKDLNVPVFLVKYPSTKQQSNNRKSIIDNLYTTQKEEDLKLSDTTHSDSASSDDNNSSTSNEEPIITTKTQAFSVQQVIHKNEIKLDIISNETMIPESLPLVESCDLNNQNVYSNAGKDEEGFSLDDIHDLKDLLLMADKKISTLKTTGSKKNLLDTDTNSISSIEGSLKGRSSNGLSNQGSEGLGSSTPLLHLYPKMDEPLNDKTLTSESTSDFQHNEIDQPEQNFEFQTIESVIDSVTENHLASDIEPVELFPSGSLVISQATNSTDSQVSQESQSNAENFIYSYVPSQGFSVQIKTELSVVTDSASVNMLKTSFKRPSLLDKYNESKVKFKEIDVIDLTQIPNQNVLVTPPPVQFSDNFKDNNKQLQLECNEVEIESGIESDSSNTEQQPTQTKSVKGSKKTEDTIANSQVLTAADKQFLSKLFVNLDTNSSRSHSFTSNSSSIVPIIHSKFTTQSKPDSFIKKEEYCRNTQQQQTTTKLISKSFSQSAVLTTTTESRVKSFVNAYSSRTTEQSQLKQVKRSNSFRTLKTEPSKLTDSGFISSLNSFSSNNLNTNNTENNSSSGNSSASSSPTNSNLLITSNGPIVKSIAKNFESSDTNNLLPNYSKPKLFTSTLTKIFGENNTHKVQRLTRHSSSDIVVDQPIKYEIANLTGSIGIAQVSPVSSTNSPESDSKLTIQVDKKTDTQVKQKCSSFSPSSFHRVLNRLVETGMNVAKSKHQISETGTLIDSSKTKEETKYELINGYEESTIQDKQDKKQRSSSYKSNSLTRLGRQQLLKISDSIQDDLDEKCKQIPKTPDSPVPKPASRQFKNHNSLPTRNFKMVDDIRSLFDKLTHSKNHNQNHHQRPTSTSVFYSDTVSDTQNGLSKVEAAKLKLTQSFQASYNCPVSNTKTLHSEPITSLPPPTPATALKSLETKLSRPESPRKGSLKKKDFTVSRGSSSLTRSPLKVRWKDMIEISNCVIQSDSDTSSSDCEQFFSDLLNDAEMVSINKNATTKLLQDPALHKDIIVTPDKKLCEGITEHKFNLKPLHATGKEFEKEMTDRIARLNAIKIKEALLDENGADKFYDDIHADLDVVLYELHSTIEHVRLSSMLDTYEESNSDEASSENNQIRFEEKITDVAVICRQFVNNSKSMISSALVNEEGVRPHVRNAMNSLCSLVVECLETNYKYLYLNRKLDETRQLLIQILNLLNTFRTTLNITYLASSKQLNESNVNLLMKQATNLASEISLLIKQFKQLF